MFTRLISSLRVKIAKSAIPDQPIQAAQDTSALQSGHKSFGFLDQIANFFTKSKDSNTPIAVSKKPLKIGMTIIFLFFGVFGVWAITAPIESAVVAFGKVTVASHRKSIQHLEGGIAESILVNEGDQVSKGEPLIRIQNIQAKANKELMQMQMYELLATRSRIDTELNGQDKVEFTQEILQNLDPRIIADQKSLFVTRKELINSQMEILEHRIKQLENEGQGVDAQMRSSEEQLRLTEEEVDAVQQLLEQGNAQKNRLLSLQRQQANLKGSAASYQASLAKIQQKIGETKLEIVNLRNKFYNDNTSEKKDINQEINKITEKIKAVSDIVERSTIVAPQDGIITNLRVHTIGGVIGPGVTIMEIIPLQDNLVIEAKIMSKDIGAILQSEKQNKQASPISSSYDRDARIRLIAFSARRVPILKGKVIQLSADTLIEDTQAPQYYTIKVSILNSELEKIPNLKLYPGMPVEVFISTQSRTLFSYLVSPITSSFTKAFKES
jgi:HlyD family secretion protein